MKIAIVTFGTRGDVQPYVAVARALQERGHDVWLSTHAEYEPFLRAHGVRPGPFMRHSFRAILESDLGRAWLASADSPREYGRIAKELFVPLQMGWLEDADAAVEGADLVLFYVLVSGALYGAERRRVPAIALAPWGMAASGEIALPGLPFAERLPRFVTRALGKLFYRISFGAMNAPNNAYRERVGLAPVRASDLVHHVIDAGIPALHLFSETVQPRPSDWPEQHEVVGFPFLPASDHTPSPALAEFLAKGPPPIYIGFGSMTGFAPEELAELTARAVRLAGVRAIVARGWAGLSPTPSDALHVVDEVPHDWLFPRVSAVVHHGGVGTLHEGLRAGRPTVVTAFFGDQPYWGRLNERLGTGPRALRRRSLTAQKLAAAIREALTPKYVERAAQLGAQIRQEHGAERAAKRIEELASRA